MTEKWAKIPEFPNYEISNLGRIDKIGKKKRIPITVKQSGNYLYASLSYAPYKSKQVNVKQLMDDCFDEHIYTDHSTDSLPEEIWKDVVGWETAYEVSNLGRVRTKMHTITTKRGTSATFSPKLKKVYFDEDGYARVSLYFNNESKLVGVHRIVAQAFIPNPNNLPQVNHKNGDKADNRAENLEWVTNTQNIRHSIDAGLRDPKVYSIPIIRLDDGTTFSSIADLHRAIGGNYNGLVHLFKESQGNTVKIGGNSYRYAIESKGE